MIAAAFGDWNVSSHSAKNRTPLAANDSGTSVDGETRRAARALSATRMSDNTAVATTAAGRAVKSSDARKSASRTALPPTNCAITAPEHSIAVSIDRDAEREGVMPFEKP